MSVKRKVTVPDGRSARMARLALCAHQLVQRMRTGVEHVLGLLGGGDRKPCRVEQPDLHEERRLIPVDVLVGELAVVELRHDAERQPHVPARRSDPREELIHLDVVREREDELVDDLLVADVRETGVISMSAGHFPMKCWP